MQCVKGWRKKIKLISVVDNRPFIIKNVFDLCFDQKFSKKSNILISLLLMEQSTGLKNLENSKCDVGYGTGMVDMLVIYFRSDKAYLNRNHKSFSRPFFSIPSFSPFTCLSVFLLFLRDLWIQLATRGYKPCVKNINTLFPGRKGREVHSIDHTRITYFSPKANWG